MTAAKAKPLRPFQASVILLNSAACLAFPAAARNFTAFAILLQTERYSRINKMKFLFFAVLTALLFASVYAVKPSQKAVIITYPNDTPSHEVDKAISALEKAGGVVTHEYSTYDHLNSHCSYTDTPQNCSRALLPRLLKLLLKPSRPWERNMSPSSKRTPLSPLTDLSSRMARLHNGIRKRQ
jgi:hypothetical protein